MIHKPMLRPRAGFAETADADGRRVYRPVSDRVSALQQSGAEMTEALELILSGDTGEEASDETGA